MVGMASAFVVWSLTTLAGRLLAVGTRFLGLDRLTLHVLVVGFDGGQLALLAAGLAGSYD